MYFNNLVKLRLEWNLKQKDLANMLNCKRTTYSTWENGRSMIPLDIIDKLALYYHVSLAYILGIEKELKKGEYNPINYSQLLENLLLCKIKYRQTYEDIAKHIGCNKSTINRYFNGEIILKIDILIALAQLYHVNIDKLCGRQKKK